MIPWSCQLSDDLHHPLQIAAVKLGIDPDCEPCRDHLDPNVLLTPGGRPAGIKLEGVAQ
jgi:hypothetical protein